jgi:hypothetical protein
MRGDGKETQRENRGGGEKGRKRGKRERKRMKRDLVGSTLLDERGFPRPSSSKEAHFHLGSERKREGSERKEQEKGGYRHKGGGGGGGGGGFV